MVSRLSIQNKIVISFLILVIAMSCAFGATSYVRIVSAMHSEIKRNGLGTVKILSQMATPYIYESDYATILDIANKLIANQEIQRLSILESNGKTWLTTHPMLEPVATDDPFYQTVFKHKGGNFREVSQKSGNAMEFIHPVLALGKVEYIIKIEISLENVKNQTAQRTRESMVIGLIMFVVAAFVSIILAKLLTNPIKVLVDGTKELSEGNLAHRIDVTTTDETGILSESFNQMAQKLEKELSTRRAAEKKLQDYTEKLEKTVEDRTSLLQTTNIQLSDEIEERKKTEYALVESRERYIRFSEVTLDGIVFHNEEGVIDVNASFSKQFGYSLEDVKGKDLIATVCHPKYRTLASREMSSIADNLVETIGMRANGETFPIELHNRSLTYEDNKLTVTSIRDKSERKKLENQLQQAQRMEGIGRLAAGIAHDLNNILSGIVTMPEILLLDLPSGSPLRGPLQSIQQSGENAAVIVQDMLTLAGRTIAVENILNPTSLVNTFIVSPESMKLKQTHPGITIELQLEENIANIKGSPIHLSKALMNLVKNGADAIEGEGKVTISVKNAFVDMPFGNYESIQQGAYVCISVTDSGTGIPSESIPYVFEPFYTKKVLGRSGTGLGMVIVWNTVKDHNGFIDITSKVDIGTKVSMYFPVTEEVRIEQTKSLEIKSIYGKRQKILVVDDIEEQRKIASILLEKLNYEVWTVPGGLEAVEFLKSKSVDLILLDMVMEPGIDGFETCKRIFTSHPNAVIILASGYAESDLVSQALDLGAKHFIKKPYSVETLGRALKTHLHTDQG